MAIYKGQLMNQETKDILYPQTSTDMVDGLEELLKQVQLLINPDFQVNQRGQTTYSNLSKNQYCVDMWRNTGGNSQDLTVEVVDDGIKLTTTQQRTVIAQTVTDVYPMNKTFTLQLSLNGAITKPITITISDTLFHLEELYIDDVNVGRVGFQCVYDKLLNLNVEVYIDGQSNVLNWVNLWEGDIAYPHVKKSYQDDLMECQEKNRYIVKALRQYLTFGIGVYYGGSIYMDTSIRNFPSGGIATFGGTFTLFAIKGKENIELITINSCVFDNLTGYLSIKFSNMSNLQNGDVCLIQTSSLNSFINVSCEPL